VQLPEVAQRAFFESRTEDGTVLTANTFPVEVGDATTKTWATVTGTQANMTIPPVGLKIDNP
jgi:hypothetical protein